MNNLKKLYENIYETDNYKINNIRRKIGKRKDSIAIVGGALGDEGKGRVTDEFTSRFLKTHDKVIHYRDNGGSNAGHTVLFDDQKIVLHQLGSGIMQKNCHIVLGKGMVLHPQDLASEIKLVKKAANGSIPASLYIDEMATLCLDTHRAFEAALKMKLGNTGATGRGIAPAYADIIYRYPLRARDLLKKDMKSLLSEHYLHYQALIKGLGYEIKDIEVPRHAKNNTKVSDIDSFIISVQEALKVFKKFIVPVYDFVSDNWNSDTPFVFEKAQALGLDVKWGTYPDVTTSDCGPDGIKYSTEAVVDPANISIRAGVIKATYTSSVGKRQMPTAMKKRLANKIREDANEYGATTGRPRDILHIDIPMLSYLFRVGNLNSLVMTHMDVAYEDIPIKICIDYTLKGKSVPYRPDLDYLSKVKPVYIELPSWDGSKLTKVSDAKDLPLNAKKYIGFISEALNANILMITTGPKRNESILFN